MKKRSSLAHLCFLLSVCSLCLGGEAPVFEFGKDGPAIVEWLVAQPFPDEKMADAPPGGPTNEGYFEDFLVSIGGEASARPSAGVTVEYKGQTVEFTPASDESGKLTLHKVLEDAGAESVPEMYVAYAFCLVRAKKESQAYLHLGFAAYARAWLNGKPLYEWRPDLSRTEMGEILPVALKAGDNTLLVKYFARRKLGQIFVRATGAKGSRAILKKEADANLQLTVDETAEPGPVKIGVGLLPASRGLFSDVKVPVRVFDVWGNEVAQGSCPLGGEAEFALPEGFTVIEARLSGFSGRVLQGEVVCCVGGDLDAAIREAARLGRERLAEGAAGDYEGLVELRAAKIEERLRESSEPSGVAKECAYQLASTLSKAARTPKALKSLRGKHEWAYISKVDGTAQPFTIWIPPDYRADRPLPLEIYLHGAGSSHLPSGTLGVGSKNLHVRVLGRGRFGRYEGLSEVDVLETLDFVRGHWSVDPHRIHVYGSSMGGGGSFKMASRHPDLFASARPECGYGTEQPVENMLHVPVYSIHSEDDYTVSISYSRAAIDRIVRWGGTGIRDEVDGYGHGVWAYKAGRDAASLWAQRQTKPEEVRAVRYVATDELARRAYWAEVAEWGPEGRPASVYAHLSADNTLYVSLDNVNAARIDLAAAPIDRAKALTIALNSTHVEEVLPPLPDDLYIRMEKGAWRIGPAAPAPRTRRLHFPGGAQALFHGEPLLVVWGTQADEATNQRIYEAAQIARRSTNAGWPEIDSYREEIPDSYMMYGRLPGKPDSEVDEADIETHNLLLLGTAEQNSVAARLADELPVKIENGRAVASDGFSWRFKNRVIGLLHFNPLAPKRLVYWVASESPEFYKAGAPLMDSQSLGTPPDFVLMAAEEAQLVAARRFDSNWQFESGYEQSPLAPAEWAPSQTYNSRVGEAVRLASGSDFALIRETEDEPRFSLAPDETRIMDLVALEYGDNLCVMDLSGREILKQAKFLKGKQTKGKSACRFVPAPDSAHIDPERTYQVAVWPSHAIGTYAALTHSNPKSFRLSELPAREALARGLSSLEGLRNAQAGK